MHLILNELNTLKSCVAQTHYTHINQVRYTDINQTVLESTILLCFIIKKDRKPVKPHHLYIYIVSSLSAWQIADASYSPIINCTLEEDGLLSCLDCCRGKEKQTCIQADYVTVTEIP